MKTFFRLALICLSFTFLLALNFRFTPTVIGAAPVADAAAIYTAKCAKCHAADGSGIEKYKKKGQQSFRDAAWQKTRKDVQLIASITNGKGEAMQAWKGKLTADEIKALVALIRSFGK